MKNYLLFSLILVGSLSQSIYSQQVCRAILIENNSKKSLYSDSIISMFYSAITSNKSKSKFVLYHWNENKHEVKLHPFSIGKEEPSNEAVFVKLFCNFATEPPLSFKRDTFGKIIRANLELEAYCDILVKGLDVAESTVINSELIQLFVGEKHSIPIPYSDYFSSDAVHLKTSNPAKYDKIASKIRQDFAEKIKETYFSIIRNNSYKIYEANAEFLCSDDKIFDVVPQDNCTDNSVKEVEINGGSRDGLVSGRRYNCLTKREIDQYYYYENLTKVEIKESAFDKSKAKTLLFGSKDLAKSFKAKEKIVVAPSEIERAQNRLNLKPNQKTINVAIVKECLFCHPDFEKTIYSSPAISLIERHAPELSYFAGLLKLEKFKDQSSKDLQASELGYNILLSMEDGILTATNAQTNEKFYTQNTNRGLMNLSATAGFSMDELSQILSIYDNENFGITIVKILSEKKNSIEELLLYNPVGFVDYSTIEIFTEAKEIVSGNSVAKLTKIGEGKVGKMYSNSLAELKVKKGEKDLFAAKAKGDKIVCKYAIK